MCSHFMYAFPEIKWGYFRKMSSAFMNAGKGPLLFQSRKCQGVVLDTGPSQCSEDTEGLVQGHPSRKA